MGALDMAVEDPTDSVDGPYSIVEARLQDVTALARIERAAAKLLEGHAPESVLNETTEEHELLDAQAEGRLWVALLDDLPVGFALVTMLGPGSPHLEEIDVDPPHGQRGPGTALVRSVCEWARRAGHSEVTLTPFRSLPWNMPFYRRLGFEEMPPAEWSPALATVVQDETDRGFDLVERRVAMRYRSTPGKRRGPIAGTDR